MTHILTLISSSGHDVDIMTPQIEEHLAVNMTLSKKHIMLNNFFGGLAWGVGSVIGATVVVTIIGYILKGLGVFTSIGQFFQQFTVQ